MLYIPNVLVINNFTEERLEKFIKEYHDSFIWNYVSQCQLLSENFIDKHKNEVNWEYISKFQILSENFIAAHEDKVNWKWISQHQILSENFIEKYVNKVDWEKISLYQKLSESFIEKYTNRIDWENISISQKLSENFIEKHADKVNWKSISIFQELSEPFIEKHGDKIDLFLISRYQKLSKKFIEKYAFDLIFKIEIEDSWHYKTKEEKKSEILETGLYECYDNYFIAYKAVRRDGLSLFNCQYKYKKGKIYETWADTSSSENSFGFGCGTFWHVKNYGECYLSKIIKVKVYYKDVARVVYNGEKIRAFKIEILN